MLLDGILGMFAGMLATVMAFQFLDMLLHDPRQHTFGEFRLLLTTTTLFLGVLSILRH
jgi:hypothetical protein